MKVYIVLSALALGCLGAQVDPVAHFLDLALSRNARILNGEPAADGEYPFQISLQYNSRHFCGGTILSTQYILTAAHCIYGYSQSSFTVRVGTNNYNSGGSVHQVVGWRMHGNYKNSAYWNNDIAVLKVSPALTLGSKVQLVKLPPQGEEQVGGSASVAIGWGSSCYGCSGIANLQKVNLRVYSDRDCLSLYGTGPTSDMVCSGKPENEQGICSGDSGGPLLVNGVQIGVTSWTRIPCGILPAVWTKVSHYISWINQNSSF